MKKFKFTIRGNEYEVHINSFEDNIAEIDVNGSVYQVELAEEVKTTKTPKLVRSTPAATKVEKLKPATSLSKVEAPLPGTIFKIKVKEGDPVKKGQVIMILEAMKMENNILAEKDGIMNKILVAEGNAVLQGDILGEIE
ncbi:MAG: biotin/lipoyl-binding protein [Cyclobacteriaceae bacterium]|nr:biotin/lipoyl-binding protein [Cyclobacteriaceae bacterium]